MSWARWLWLPIVALALGVLVGPTTDEERKAAPLRSPPDPVERAEYRAKERKVNRGEIVRSSLFGRPSLDYFLFVPAAASTDFPVLVAIHGISRNAREQAEAFAPFAERHGFLVAAPHFDEKEYEDYQRLGRRGRGRRADAALDHLVDEFTRSGLASGELFLFGYSGGGQFVHRYVMAHPERVRAGIVASPGWYTFPDPRVDYPYGIRLDAELPGVRLSPDAFLRVPMLAVVGEADRERDENLRRSRALDRQQGRDRVERAERWVHAMRTAAKEREIQPRVELATLEGAGHSFEESMQAGLGELVVDFLSRWRSPREASGNEGLRASEPPPPGRRWCVAGPR